MFYDKKIHSAALQKKGRTGFEIQTNFSQV